jgi:hypothetical protein
MTTGPCERAYVEGMLSPEATADLTKWITEEGWKTIGMETNAGTSRESSAGNARA